MSMIGPNNGGIPWCREPWAAWQWERAILGYMPWERCPVINDNLCLSEDISMKTTRPKQSLSLRMAWQCGSFWCNCFTGPPTPFTLCGAFDEMSSEHFPSFGWFDVTRVRTGGMITDDSLPLRPWGIRTTVRCTFWRRTPQAVQCIHTTWMTLKVIVLCPPSTWPVA